MSPAGAPDDGVRNFCSLCGRPLAPDQEWCLECGAARTVIARPPDWRIPVLVAALTVLVIVGVLALVLSQLSTGTGRLEVLGAAAAPARSTPALAGWPPGLDGYTVILAQAPSQAAARRRGDALLAHLSGVGVLDTVQHPEMKPPGAWEIFDGRYPSYPAALAAAQALRRRGQPGARPSLVQHPGG